VSETTKVSSEFRPLYESGEALASDIDKHLQTWLEEKGEPVRGAELPQTVREATEKLLDRAHEWFNLLSINVLPQTTYDRTHTNMLLRRLTATLSGMKFYEERHIPPQFSRPAKVEHNVAVPVVIKIARDEATAVMHDALRLVRSAPSPLSSQSTIPQRQTTSHISRTAFILMWMDDKNHPELVDVHILVKEVFAEFGIAALRADEVEHQDRITDVVLENIARSEFLFADLSGERPNVYYEVGYAHALGKHPILYRRTGTPLHFDLSVHNVPEYENVTRLRHLLRDRLAAMTGRTPAGPAQ
jgi:hypothetical protein